MKENNIVPAKCFIHYFHLQIVLEELDYENRNDHIRMKIIMAQFKLFVMLCKGGYTEFIEYLEDKEDGIVKKIGIQIDFDFLKKAIEFTESYPMLRTKLIELLKGKHYDVHEQ